MEKKKGKCEVRGCGMPATATLYMCNEPFVKFCHWHGKMAQLVLDNDCHNADINSQIQQIERDRHKSTGKTVLTAMMEARDED